MVSGLAVSDFFPYYKRFEIFFNSLTVDRPISSQKTRKYIRTLFGIQTRHPNVLLPETTRVLDREVIVNAVRSMTGDDSCNVLLISSGSCYSRTQ
jgi:hypothetical protein